MKKLMMRATAMTLTAVHCIWSTNPQQAIVIYRPRSGVVLARADSWTLENVQERLQKMEEAMMI